VLSWKVVCSLTTQGLSASARISLSERTCASWSFLNFLDVSHNACWRLCPPTYHLGFDERLQRIDLSIILSLDQLDLTKSTLTNNFDSLKILRSFLCPQEAKEFSFSFAHLVLLLLLTGLGDIWILQKVIQIQGSAMGSVIMVHVNFGRSDRPLISLSCPVYAVLEEGAD
jgi:hypothetical protein